MDEQPFLQNALEQLLSEGASYPQSLRGLAPAQLEKARLIYWEHVRRKVQLQPGQRLIDKNPLNILRLAVIRRLFPAAPIVLAIRHPCDVLLSCYMQHFGDADFALAVPRPSQFGGGLPSHVRFLVSPVGDTGRRRSRGALRATGARLRSRNSRGVRSVGAALRASHAAASSTCERQGIHQHSELFSGGETGQHSFRGSLAQLRAGILKACCRCSILICNGGAMHPDSGRAPTPLETLNARAVALLASGDSAGARELLATAIAGIRRMRSPAITMVWHAWPAAMPVVRSMHTAKPYASRQSSTRRECIWLPSSSAHIHSTLWCSTRGH